MKNLSIFTKKTYTDSSGQEQTAWYRVGHIKFTETGGKFLSLYQQPDTQFYLFDLDDTRRKAGFRTDDAE